MKGLFHQFNSMHRTKLRTIRREETLNQEHRMYKMYKNRCSDSLSNGFILKNILGFCITVLMFYHPDFTFAKPTVPVNILLFTCSTQTLSLYLAEVKAAVRHKAILTTWKPASSLPKLLLK